ncbi:Dps family protein [Corynebacterium kroppenstedtii]|uniref:Dps family protein n=1 Tax=Corynebacterium sp. PCR 32 TaxID=3351342 RepID=UPI003096BC2B
MTSAHASIGHSASADSTVQTTPAFSVPGDVVSDLQKVLVDFIDLSLVAKEAHWNILGPNFRDLHLNLDELVSVAREGTDEIAERMRALNGIPDGRTAVVAASSSLPEFPAGEIVTHDAISHVVKAINAVTETMRDVHDRVDAADPTTADLLHEYIKQLEQQAWFISAEIRTPSGK